MDVSRGGGRLYALYMCPPPATFIAHMYLQLKNKIEKKGKQSQKPLRGVTENHEKEVI